MIVVPPVFWLVLRWAMPQEEVTRPSPAVRIARLFALFPVVLVGLFWLFQLAELIANVSLAIRAALGPAGFLATFLFQVSDILRVMTPALGALVSGSLLSSTLGRIGQRAAERGPRSERKNDQPDSCGRSRCNRLRSAWLADRMAVPDRPAQCTQPGDRS